MLPLQTNFIVICHYRHFVTVMTVMTEYLITKRGRNERTNNRGKHKAIFEIG